MEQHRGIQGFLTALPLVFALNANAAEPPPVSPAQKQVMALLQPVTMPKLVIPKLAEYNQNSEVIGVQEEVVVSGRLPEKPKPEMRFDLDFRKKPDFKQRVFEVVRDRIGVTNLELDRNALTYQFYKSDQGVRFQAFVGERERTKVPEGMDRLMKDKTEGEAVYGLRFVHEF